MIEKLGLEPNTLIKNEFEILNDIEIHMLICKKDMLLAINNLNSLQKHDEFKQMIIYLHDDGSLDNADCETLVETVPNVIIIRREDADIRIVEYINMYPNCAEYRLGKNEINLWHKIKLFDYYYFSKTKKIFGLDTDLLFMKKPEEIINLMIEGTPFYFPDVQSAYCFNEPKEEVTVLDRVNTGVIYIPSEDYYKISDIENALKNLVGKGVNYFPSWIEQSAFAHMFYCDGRYKMLDDKKYTIPYFSSVDIKTIECLHFVSYPAVRDTYKTYTDYLELKSGELIHDLSYIVVFEEKNIPLEIKIYKYGNMYNLVYYWGLEKTDQHQLDHIFKVVADDSVVEFKCQSNSNGFLILNTKADTFTINHTYDWYGDMDWKELEILKCK